MSLQLDPAVLWFSGRSGSGKFTLSKRVCFQLRIQGYRCKYFSENAIRKASAQYDASGQQEDKAAIQQIAKIAQQLLARRFFMIGTFPAPYHNVSRIVRSQCDAFVEIYVVFGKAERNLNGANWQYNGEGYEPPESPELEINMSQMTTEEAVGQVMQYLEQRG